MIRSEEHNRWNAAIAQVHQDQAEKLDLTDVPDALHSKAAELQEQINRAPIWERPVVAQRARSELAVLVEEHRTKEAAELAEAKAHASHKSDIARHHRELYATDAQYRATTDAVMGESETRSGEFKDRQEQLQGIAQKHGITTPHDAAVAEAQAAYEEALRHKSDNPDAVLEAEAELHRRARLQAIALEQELRKRGHHADADVIHGIAKEEDKAFDQTMQGYDKWTNGYLDALRRKLALDGLSAEDEQELAAAKKEIDRRRADLMQTKNQEEAQQLSETYQKDQKDVQQKTEAQQMIVTQRAAEGMLEATRKWLARDGLTDQEKEQIAQLGQQLKSEREAVLADGTGEKTAEFVQNYTKKAEELALELGEPASRYEVAEASNTRKVGPVIAVAKSSTGPVRST